MLQKKSAKTEISSTNITYSSSEGLAQDILDYLVSGANNSLKNELGTQNKENKILDIDLDYILHDG